jgi:N-formylglutamate amidohydrolase
MLVAHVSRYVCDLNRGEQDLDAHAAEGGTALSAPHGLVWRTTTEDKPALLAPLPREEIERRLQEIYRPYHQALERLIREKQERFGFAIVLCAHSMPSYGRAGHSDPGRHRADVVPGSRGRTTATRKVVETPEQVAQAFGWTVRHDDPYKGGFSTGHYGRPARGVHALQVELARRLYMNEQNLRKDPVGFARTREYCLELTDALGRLQLSAA